MNFVPCTEILMADQTKRRIDRVVIGDLVYSLVHGQNFEPRKVKSIIKAPAKQVVRIVTDMGRIHCDPKQAFYTGHHKTPYGWMTALALLLNDGLISMSPQYAFHTRRVTEIHSLSHSEIRTYNTSADDLMLYGLMLEVGCDNYIANSVIVKSV